MQEQSVTKAIILLIVGNLFATFCDAFIKAAGHDIPIFQFTFMRILFILFVLLPFSRFINWSDLWAGGRIHFLRGNMWVISSILLVFSLQLLPLSTANSIFYMAPIFIVVLAAVFFREAFTHIAIIAVISGFLGVVIILRPIEVGWGALYAVAFSLILAMGSLLIRKLPKNQSLIHSLWMTQLFALPFSFGLCVWENAPLDLSMFVYAAGSSIFSIGYSFTCIIAYKHAAANRIASAEYTGLIFAVLVGWMLFDEIPDFWLAIGVFFIIVPVYLLGRQGRKNRKVILEAA